MTNVEGTQLVVNALGPTARLAWESTVNGVGAKGISRLTVDVDALTGAVLRDPTITNLSCQDAANNTTFSGTDDAWGNGNATNRETGCVDALFAAQTEARMLGQWLGRNGMDGAGGAWPIRVGLAQVNAFYDGTQVQVGHNNANQWIGAIDVIAHEMGHGIDDHTPGGISGNGTQEFIADAFGAATEWFANEPAPFDVPDFTVGEQVDLVGSGPIRNMANPSVIGDPNCYSSSIPSTEVHAAAGPGNHWFYLLAEGSNPTDGQPTSPTCNGSTVVGLGVQNAITILYNAMLMKTTASSYLNYRIWTLWTVINIFPFSCTQFTRFNTVKAAWDAVGVPAQLGEPTYGRFDSTNVPKSIPDNNATGVTSVLTVFGNGIVGSLSLSLNITHTWRGDLVVTLIAPDGTSFIVSDRAGGSADNIIISNQAITAFNGHTATGTWRLKVQDLAAADVGTLNSWSLTMSPSDFGITSAPTSRTLVAGTSVTYTINTFVQCGAAETIALSVSGLPAGVTGSFSPNNVLAGAPSTLTLTADPTAGPTTTSFTITGTSTTATHTTNASVTVPLNDFSITPNPTSRTVAASAITMYTINTAVVSGAAQNIALSVSGLPAGVTGSFSPDSVPAGGTSTLTLTADATASAGMTQFTITGAGSSANHTVNASVTVAPNDFSITPAPTSQTVTKITSATYTINTAVTVGVSQDISLSVFGLPSGVTGSFSSTNVTAGDSPTLTLTATEDAIPNTTEFTVTATGASATHMANASVTVENPPHWLGSASPNLPTVDNGSSCDTLTVTTMGGDSSLAKLDISGSHSNRPSLRGELTHNGVTVEAFRVGDPTGFPPGGGTFGLTNHPVPGLPGDASGTWMLCIIDIDAFGDVGVLNTWSVHD